MDGGDKGHRLMVHKTGCDGEALDGVQANHHRLRRGGDRCYDGRQRRERERAHDQRQVLPYLCVVDDVAVTAELAGCVFDDSCWCWNSETDTMADNSPINMLMKIAIGSRM